MEQSTQAQESNFIEQLDCNGLPASGFAVAPARSVNAALMERLADARCHEIDNDGKILELKIIGTSTHLGQLLVCIPPQSSTQPWAAASLVQIGQLMLALSHAIQQGLLKAGQIDFSRLRLQARGFIILSLTSAGSRRPDTAADMLDLLSLQNQLALQILAKLRPNSPGNYSRQAGFYLPALYQDKYRLNPQLRQFLANTVHSSPGSLTPANSDSKRGGKDSAINPEFILAEWLKIGRILLAEDCLEALSASRLRFARQQDKFCRRLYAAGTTLQKHRMPLIATALILVFAAALIIPAVQNKLKPPLSAGMMPETLVIHFFKAVNELDIAFVDSVLVKPSASPFGNSLYTMAAVTTIRNAAEGSRMLMPPEEAAAAGAADLKWGVEELVILSLQAEGEEKMQARVQYTWHADGQIERRDDLITLILRKGSWIIQEHRSTRLD
ncbi:MAG: hypothetical protein KKC64_13990 [Spirochaetes bacterium]|nr:hypothetical protein [Spirochaetota bacterium]